MLPWGHAAVGYLVYRFVLGARDRLPPDGWAVLALGFGTQFPDLVDKPLAWSFGLLPAGRSLAHSAVTMGAVGAVVLAVARRRGVETPARAFLVGYATHVVTDGVEPLVRGDVDALSFVLYPVLPVRPLDRDYDLLAFFLNLKLTPLTWSGLAVTAVGLWRWYRDGTPGVAELRWCLARLRPSSEVESDP